ncbi:MAG: hypothetical protein WAV09_03150 [Minisyncoccia bacterium]
MIAALFQVESESIRQWATSERNGPIWLEIAARMLAKYDTCAWRWVVDRLTVAIVSEAIGL